MNIQSLVLACVWDWVSLDVSGGTQDNGIICGTRMFIKADGVQFEHLL
jgi:hypothetical protein